MRALPAGILTLLKSRSMLGIKRPSREVGVSDGVSTLTVPDILSIRRRSELGMAAELTLTIDNKGGKYTPDNVGTWYHILWPNSTITVDQGYGTDRVRTFTGIIDKVTVSRAPKAQIVIKARDKRKLLLDRIITDPSTGEHTGLFAEQDVTVTVETLAEWAGFAVGDITAETTGLVMPALAWDLRSYADILLGLEELTGFETVVTDDGKFIWRRSSDRQPEAVDEAIVLTGTNWTNLANDYVVSGSDRVCSAISGGGTAYDRTTDYEIELGSPARIRRRVGSTIGDGATVYASYVYAAYSFRAGEDLRAIDYTIDDEDLYYAAIVKGEEDSTERTAIIGIGLFGAPLTYQLSTQKVLHVPMPNAHTQVQCDAIAARIAVEMATRARRAEVATIAVPWLQVGDCIRVIESTTTISEIYRVTAMDLIQDDGGFVAVLEIYYYGYTPEV